MPKRRSAAERVDRAFKRVVKLQRKYEFPRFEDEEAYHQLLQERPGQDGVGATWASAFTNREASQLAQDVPLICKYLHRIPWENADRV